MSQSGQLKVNHGITRRNVIALASIAGTTVLTSSFVTRSAFADLGCCPSVDRNGNGRDRNHRDCDVGHRSWDHRYGDPDSHHHVCQGSASGAGGGGGGSGGGGAGGGGSAGGGAGGGGGNAGGNGSGRAENGGGDSWDFGFGSGATGSNSGGASSGGGGGLACFLAGTKILTETGERAVEDLRAGDKLPTIEGRIRAIKRVQSWAAHRRLDQKWCDDVAPIKVCRSALGANLPDIDLYLSPHHSLYVDSALVPVGHLVNGKSIVRCSKYDAESITYFHIEFEDHQVIWAHGASVESLLTKSMTPYAPIYSGGRRFELSSRLRSAISPWFDKRTTFDMIRDRIEERSESDFAIG